MVGLRTVLEPACGVDGTLMSRFVVTYFSLAERDTIESYRQWSLEYVRPVMRAMPSVIDFVDAAVVGSMDNDGPHWDGCELIKVSDFAAFESDNQTGAGGTLARLWRERLDSWSIGYLEDLEGVAPVATNEP